MEQITKHYLGEFYAEGNMFYFHNSYGNKQAVPTSDVEELLNAHRAKLFPVENLRKTYFSMRDEVYFHSSTGYSKIELHELAKKVIFPKLVDDPDNFIEGGKAQKELSVTWLSEQGWKSFIEEFKLFCAENFNTYL